jgi:hypothetical protein
MALKTLAQAGLEIVGACWVAAAVFAGILPVAPILGDDGFGTAVWAVLDGVAVAWLVRSARPAFRVLTHQLTRLRTLSGDLPLKAEMGGPSAVSIARVLLVVAYIGVLQAILRRPLVMVLGMVADPSIEAAWLAVGVLAVLALALARLHVVVHPVVVGTVRGILDAIFATAESPSLQQPSLAPAAPSRPVSSDATTIAPTTSGEPDATTMTPPTSVPTDATTVKFLADDTQATTKQRQE